jgi:diphthine synthase
MTLNFIGIGLCDKTDITVKGLEAIRSSEYVYLEHYTSILTHSSKEELELYYGKKIILASRNLVESDAETMLDQAKNHRVAFLVVGDVFGATTHMDLFLRAKLKGIEVQIINNASIINAVGNVGLELYKFGKTTSMVFFDKDWKPATPYTALKDNLSIGLHTLVLLDIKIAEPSKEDILKGNTDTNKNLPPRFMTVNQALEQFLELEHEHKHKLISKDTKVIGVARLGSKTEKIVYGTIAKLIEYNFGEPIHCLIIPGKMHFIEEEVLKLYELK